MSSRAESADKPVPIRTPQERAEEIIRARRDVDRGRDLYANRISSRLGKIVEEHQDEIPFEIHLGLIRGQAEIFQLPMIRLKGVSQRENGHSQGTLTLGFDWIILPDGFIYTCKTNPFGIHLLELDTLEHPKPDELIDDKNRLFDVVIGAIQQS